MKEMNTTQNCEPSEMLISSWLDQPLGRAEQRQMVDHLVDCETCRDFYRDVRALDGWVDLSRERIGAAAATDPSPELWSAIERRATRPRVAGTPWLRAAAAIILAVGLGFVFVNGFDGNAPPPVDAEIELGSRAGQMSEARFLQLTREVLQAERRYHSAMYQVMQQVVSDTGGPELPSEGLVVPAERSESGERESVHRGPA